MAHLALSGGEKLGAMMNQDESEWLAIYFPQGGPLPVINGVTTRLTGVIKPQLAIYKAIYRGPISTFITSRDPPYTFYPHFSL